MSDIPDITYIFPRGSSKAYTFLKNLFEVGYLWNQYIKEKYYKGTDSILYFPYVPNNDLKVCPKVKIPYCYGGLKSDNITFDDFLLYDWLKKERDIHKPASVHATYGVTSVSADYIFDQIAKCQNNYSEFDYEAHKEIEEYNKNLPDPRLSGYVLDNSPLPDWTKENDPSLSGKVNKENNYETI